MVDHGDEENDDEGVDLRGFNDVEAFLSEHNLSDGNDLDSVPEEEEAEALAVSWRERKQEITRLHRSKRFDAAQGARKSFRVEN